MFTPKQLKGEIHHRTNSTALMMLKAARILRDVASKLSDPALGEIPNNFLDVSTFCNEVATSIESKTDNFQSPEIERLKKMHEFGTRRHKAILEGRRYD